MVLATQVVSSVLLATGLRIQDLETPADATWPTRSIHRSTNKLPYLATIAATGTLVVVLPRSAGIKDLRHGTLVELAAEHGIRLPEALVTEWPPRLSAARAGSRSCRMASAPSRKSIASAHPCAARARCSAED